MTIKDIIRMQKANPEHIYLLVQGAFYHAYNEGAEHLHAITGYKIRQCEYGKLLCFPVSSLGCVIDKIKEHYEGHDVVIEPLQAHIIIKIDE